MKTSDFEYHLPPELIAQEPAPAREQARMLVLNRQTCAWEHRRVTDLPEYLRAGDLLVVNDTRVIPARVFGHKPGTGGRVEILLLEETAPGRWDALLRASRRPGVGSWVELGSGRARVQVIEEGELGRVKLQVECAEPFLDFLEREGVPPLPPYIRRDYSQPEFFDADRSRYQTIYACRPGAVAAPTAGLHFTEELLARLAARGVARTAITLHVGAGTFRPIIARTVEEHRMDEERYEIPAETAELIERTGKQGGRVVAVGSTTVRALETAAAEHGRVVPCAGRTGLFIYPPFLFKVAGAMLTNFHLPRSSLLMMVCALAGKSLVLQAYEEAVAQRYRFYSYGDCMLIL